MKIIYIEFPEGFEDIQKVIIPDKGIAINRNFDKLQETEVIFHPTKHR